MNRTEEVGGTDERGGLGFERQGIAGTVEGRGAGEISAAREGCEGL